MHVCIENCMVLTERMVCLQELALPESGHTDIVTLPFSLFAKLFVPQALPLKQSLLGISPNNLCKEKVPVFSVTSIR